jgi:hypothetical protein
MKSILYATLIPACLIGCASNSGVTTIGKDTYLVSRQAATGFSGSGTLKAEVFQEATQFCERSGKHLQVVSTHEAAPPYIFGNFPKAEVQFMCLNAKDAELGRPKLRKEPDSVVEVKSEIRSKVEVTPTMDVYNELIKLDELRKKGIISDAEFDSQKKKILSRSQ